MKIQLAIFALSLFAIQNSVAMSKKQTSQRTPTASTAPLPADVVWVGKSDEAKSCEKKRGIALDSAATVLKSQGIQLLAKKKLHDSKMRIQMCGADKGDLNGFLIQKKDLEKAEKADFKAVPTGTY